MPEDFATRMILMGVGDEDFGDGVAIVLSGLHDAVNFPRRVHHGGLARGRVANEVDVVLHLPAFELLEVECLRHIISGDAHAASLMFTRFRLCPCGGDALGRVTYPDVIYRDRVVWVRANDDVNLRPLYVILYELSCLGR